VAAERADETERRRRERLEANRPRRDLCRRAQELMRERMQRGFDLIS
jgi:hypothetical protein